MIPWLIFGAIAVWVLHRMPAPGTSAVAPVDNSAVVTPAHLISPPVRDPLDLPRGTADRSISPPSFFAEGGTEEVIVKNPETHRFEPQITYSTLSAVSGWIGGGGGGGGGGGISGGGGGVGGGGHQLK